METGNSYLSVKTTKQKVVIQREKHIMDFLKDLFIAEISKLLQKRRHFWSFLIT